MNCLCVRTLRPLKDSPFPDVNKKVRTSPLLRRNRSERPTSGGVRALGRDFPEVLKAARTGSEFAWTQLYRAYAPGIRSYLKGRGASDPDDLTGEVFLQVVTALHNFSGDERDFRSWIFTVAHNRFVDERRAVRSRRDAPFPEEVIHSRAASGDVEGDALLELGGDHVRALIGSLTPDQQSVLLLRLLAGLTVDEVARAIGKKPGSVKALQRRGIASLRKKWAASRNPLSIEIR
jgi:RNA polymerase sigma factor (sigma-70 family)